MEKEIIFDVDKKTGKSKAELKKMLDFWKEKLEMKDWKIDLKIVDFKRKNGYRQSGDFIANPPKKEASILMTCSPWRGDEEYTLVHELIHVLVYEYDKKCEDLILKYSQNQEEEHGEYMDKLEETVHKLTRIILGRTDR